MAPLVFVGAARRRVAIKHAETFPQGKPQELFRRENHPTTSYRNLLMSSATQQPGPERSWGSDTRSSSFDKVRSLLLALLVMVGFFVGLLFLIWLTSVMRFRTRVAPVEIIEELAGRGEAAAGVANDLEEPGVEELADVAEPQLSETLEAVTSAVSSVAATMEAFEGNATAMGTGSGLGDSRSAGPGGDGDADIVPRWDRWRIKFSTKSEKEYAAQLDFFKIELGLIGGGKPQVDYASSFSRPKPQSWSKPDAKNEKRLRFNYTSGSMRAMDLRMLSRAGFSTTNREPLQFFPPATENLLAQIELAAAGGRKVTQIGRTVFGVKPAGGGYQFHVVEQLYR